MSPSQPPEGTDSGEHYCPVAATMELLNGKWTLHILCELMDGCKRFNELSRALGSVSSRTLACRLRFLEQEGIVRRSVIQSIPPWVEYELTDKGQDLKQVIGSIAFWGQRYMQPESRPPTPTPTGQ